MLTRRKVDICCLQEVRYKNEGCITFGSGDQKYKLWYAGNDQSSNGVGIMMKQGLAERVIEVNRHSDRLMSLKLILGDTVWNMFSLYAPQVRRILQEKEAF